MTASEDIYQERILDHYEHPFHKGVCPRATHGHEDDNPLCGDQVRVELEIDPQGHICDAWFNGQGCCVSQAAASMLVERMQGRTVDEARGLSAPQMLELFGARLTPNRQKCCLLAWRVLQQALYSPVAADGREQPAGPASATPACRDR